MNALVSSIRRVTTLIAGILCALQLSHALCTLALFRRRGISGFPIDRRAFLIACARISHCKVLERAFCHL